MGRFEPKRPTESDRKEWSSRVVNAPPRWAEDLREPQRRAAENRPRFDRTDRITRAWLRDLVPRREAGSR